jgi:hypothetical protein
MHTTVAVTPETRDRINAKAREHGMSAKEYLGLAVQRDLQLEKETAVMTRMIAAKTGQDTEQLLRVLLHRAVYEVFIRTVLPDEDE